MRGRDWTKESWLTAGQRSMAGDKGSCTSTPSKSSPASATVSTKHTSVTHGVTLRLSEAVPAPSQVLSTGGGGQCLFSIDRMWHCRARPSILTKGFRSATRRRGNTTWCCKTGGSSHVGGGIARTRIAPVRHTYLDRPGAQPEHVANDDIGPALRHTGPAENIWGAGEQQE